MTIRLLVLAAAVTSIVALGACSSAPAPTGVTRSATGATRPAGPDSSPAAALPLAGKVVVVDPGHQLGNSFHRKQIDKQVDAGGLRKACNTHGTATTSGYRESAFTLSVAKHVRARLTAQGATVVLTRIVESKKLWGPCVNVRGKSAEKAAADVLVSIHADGTPSRYHGFFVIRPAYRSGITDDIHAPSRKLSYDVRSGLEHHGVKRANYLGGDGLDTRNDMGTLNLSSAPAVMVELGNMKNPTDAKHMKSAKYRDEHYAAGIARGVSTYLRR